LELRYSQGAINYIEAKLADVDSRIKKNQQQLEVKGDENLEHPPEFLEKIESIEKEIKALLDDSIRLGEEGNIDESEKSMEQAELLR